MRNAIGEYTGGSQFGDESDFFVSSAAKLTGREIKNDFLNLSGDDATDREL